jgi:archaellum component FlaF (FlaF/FlaG flagellin family)
MGLSVSIASAIVLAGWIVFIGAISTAMLSGMNSFGLLVNSMSKDDVKLGVQLELRITSVESSAINLTVTNTGAKDLFLEHESYAWNSIIVTYNSTYNNTGWQTYLIDNYTVLAISVTGSNNSFDPASHRSINSGEQALIQVELPSGAPNIGTDSLVTVVFVSQYGVSAEKEIFFSA